MTMQEPSDSVLRDFSGQAPLFPLPNVVLFPDTTLPMHIFEPRYRQMTADTLEKDGLIAMALIRGERIDELGVPLVYPTVGLGKIVAHERLEDGRYMLLLKGLTRARIVNEVDSDLPYRIGNLELASDVIAPTPDFNRQERADEIAHLFCNLFSETEFQRVTHQAMTTDVALGKLCDVIAGALPIPPKMMQMFLEERNSDIRSRMLWQLLKRMDRIRKPRAKSSVSFPPVFSHN